jgi:basic amino acid/polyamine antiporter, APA family
MQAELSSKQIGWPTASAIVVASMVGVGVFTSLSFQVHSLSSPFAILVLWLVGAVVALLGALCYAELGAALPRSGGEYHLLSRIFHPALGFLAGWISLIAGFAAPIAAAAMAFSAYGSKVSPLIATYPVATALLVTLLVSFVHMVATNVGARFQVVMTALKVALMLLLVISAFRTPAVQGFAIMPAATDWSASLSQILSQGFAVSLVYVSYAYSGWNAAIYVAGETRNPQATLPRALALSTLAVAVLYLLVNYAFLRVVPTSEMLAIVPFGNDIVGKELAVGFLAGKHIFGQTGGSVVGGLIALCLISSISAMVLTGPRVLATMAQDYQALSFLAPAHAGIAPTRALLVQWLVVAALLLSAGFETVTKYIGITLSIFTCLCVLGLMRLRFTEPNLPRPFRTPLYPLTPILFLAVNAWMLFYLGRDDPKALAASAATIVAGLVFYAFMPKRASKSL